MKKNKHNSFIKKYPCQMYSKRDKKSGACFQENYRKTTQVVRPCEETERGAPSEKNARCGQTRENKKREAKPKMERCV